MNCSKFKTMRHIETVRNYLEWCAGDMTNRGRIHDQSKLQEPEASTFDKMTEKLRGCTYGSSEYNGFLGEMRAALDHHYSENNHHPEHFKNGILDMNLFDIIEMLVDWKSAGLRHNDGDIRKSLEINSIRFNIPEPIMTLLENTVEYIENEFYVEHHAEES